MGLQTSAAQSLATKMLNTNIKTLNKIRLGFSILDLVLFIAIPPVFYIRKTYTSHPQDYSLQYYSPTA